MGMLEARVIPFVLFALAACQSKPETEVGEDGTATATDTGATTGSESCTLEGCAAEEWCDWTADSCGLVEPIPSECRPRPPDCTGEPSMPVCGCDNEVYDSVCQANAAGVDVAADDSGCPALNGFFACGDQWCSSLLEYCELWHSDVGDEPDVYYCLPFPDACAGMGMTLGCECLAWSMLGECFGCEAVDGGYILNCGN